MEKNTEYSNLYDPSTEHKLEAETDDVETDSDPDWSRMNAHTSELRMIGETYCKLRTRDTHYEIPYATTFEGVAGSMKMTQEPTILQQKTYQRISRNTILTMMRQNWEVDHELVDKMKLIGLL